MKKFLFMYLNIINDKFLGVDYELYSTYIRTFLMLRDIKTEQYINLNNLEISRIVEDISSFEYDNIVIYINEYNYYLSKCIVNLVCNKNDKKKFYCIGPNSNYIKENLYDEINIYKYMKQEIIDVTNDFLNESGIKNNITTEECKCVHPYSTGIVPVSEVYNLGLLSSIGCYGKCSFCSYSNGNILLFDIDKLIEELKYINKNKIFDDKIIWFYDDCFSYTKQRIIELCSKIVSEDIRLRFWCCLRYDIMSYDVAVALKNAGFNDIVVGFESASENVHNTLGKLKIGDTHNDFIEKIKDIIKYTKKIGIDLILSVNFGIKDECLEDAMKTFDFIKIHNNIMYSVNYMTVFNNSRCYKEYFDTKRVEQGSTKLPQKTYYTKYNIDYIDKNMRNTYLKNTYLLSYNDNNKEIKFKKMITGIFNNNDIIIDKFDYLDVKNIDEAGKFICNNLKTDSIISYGVDKLTLENIKLYCDNRKTIKLNIKQYNDFIKKSYKNNIYVENLALYMTKNIVRYKLNNLIRTSEITVKSLSSLKDIEIFVSCFNKFCNNNTFSMKQINEFIFQNMCIFSNKCYADINPRLTLKNSNIYLCNSDCMVGNVDNSVSSIKKAISELVANNKGCVCLKTDIKEKVNCIKNNNPLMYVFVNTINFILYNFTNLLSNDKQIKIYCDLNYCLKNKYIDINKNFVLIKIDKTIVVYNSFDKIGYILDDYYSNVYNNLFIEHRDLLDKSDINEVKRKLSKFNILEN